MTVAVYLPVRGFNHTEVDDPVYVFENPQVREGVTIDGITWALTTGTAANWHPLTWVSHMLDVQLFGLNPGAHHIVSLAFHVATTVLLLLLLVRLTGALWRSAFVAAVFALHPLHVESVAWIAERKDVLSGLFWMLTVYAYVGYVRYAGSVGSVRSVASVRFAVVVVVYALGLMAKPMLVTLPLVLLFLDYWPLKRAARGARRLVAEKLPLFLLAIASSIVTIIVQQHGGAVASVADVSVSERLITAIVGTATYLEKMFWPSNLSFLYPLRGDVSALAVVVSLFVLGAITFVAIRLRASRPAVFVGWLWFVAALLPVSGLFQTGVQAFADRYTYLPMIGVSIMLAWAAPDAWSRLSAARAAGFATGGLAIIAMIVTTSRQLPVWRNNTTLWTQATRVTLHVDEYGAHMSLGNTLIGTRRFAEAREHYLEASRLKPESSEARHGVGTSYLRAGSATTAIGPLEEAVRLAPDDPDPRADLGAAYVLSGRIDDAIREYRRLVELRPAETRFRSALDTLLARRK